MAQIAFVEDDGGRSKAGFKGKAGDCVVRAVAIATDQYYTEVYKAMAAINAGYRGRAAGNAKGQRSARNGVWTQSAAFKRYMAALGWQWRPTMQIGGGCRVHLRADELPPGRLIVSLSRHMAAVIDGVLHDTHDSSRGGTRCVYGYWTQGVV